MSKGRKETDKNDKQYQECIKCNKSKALEPNFYKVESDLFPSGKYPVCKSCLSAKLPPTDPDNIDYVEAVKRLLGELNRPFIYQVWISSIEESKRRNRELFGIYMKNLSMPHNKHLRFKDSDTSNPEIIDDVVSNNPKIIKSEFESKHFELTQEDVQTQRDCVKLLGYDPFDGYLTSDRKFMYAELIPYLDEDTLEDQHKISIIIQIINNNNQIRKIDLLINRLSSDDQSLLKNNAEIKNLTTTKKSITDSNDKLAKENAIAIKHRGDKKAGRSTLGYLMKDLRELGFESAEEDYYDMKKSYGMQVTADISNKAILSQLNFDEKDIEDMFKEQRELIIELQKNKEELEEKLRLANIQILELKNSGGN